MLQRLAVDANCLREKIRVRLVATFHGTETESGVTMDCLQPSSPDARSLGLPMRAAVSQDPSTLEHDSYTLSPGGASQERPSFSERLCNMQCFYLPDHRELLINKTNVFRHLRHYEQSHSLFEVSTVVFIFQMMQQPLRDQKEHVQCCLAGM